MGRGGRAISADTSFGLTLSGRPRIARAQVGRAEGYEASAEKQKASQKGIGWGKLVQKLMPHEGCK